MFLSLGEHPLSGPMPRWAPLPLSLSHCCPIVRLFTMQCMCIKKKGDRVKIERGKGKLSVC